MNLDKSAKLPLRDNVLVYYSGAALPQSIPGNDTDKILPLEINKVASGIPLTMSSGGEINPDPDTRGALKFTGEIRAKFDGVTDLMVLDTLQEFTLSFWSKTSSGVTQSFTLPFSTSVFPHTSRIRHVLAINDQGQITVQEVSGDKGASYAAQVNQSGANILRAGTNAAIWNHYAVTYRRTKNRQGVSILEMYFFMNSKKYATYHVNAIQAGPGSIADNSMGYLFRTGGTTSVAQMCIYNIALQDAQISGLADLTKPDRALRLVADSSPVTVRTTHPLGFRLFDAFGHGALRIENGLSPVLNAVIQNAGKQSVTLSGKDLAGGASPWHFKLLFRRSVLSDVRLKPFLDTPQHVTIRDWTVADPLAKRTVVVTTSLQADGWVSMAISATGGTDLQLDPGQAIALALPLAAEREQGARGTAVELVPNPDCVELGDAGVAGRLTHHLEVLDANARTTLFNIAFTGEFGNRVATSAALTTRLELGITLAPDVSDNVGSATNWADLRVHVVLPDDLAGAAPETGGALSYDAMSDTAFVYKYAGTGGPSWPLKLTLPGLSARTATPGPTRLKIRLLGIGPAGGVDEEQDILIEKSPLLFVKGKVGLGTAAPQAELDVAGDLRASGKVFLSMAPPQVSGQPVATIDAVGAESLSAFRQIKIGTLPADHGARHVVEGGGVSHSFEDHSKAMDLAALLALHIAATQALLARVEALEATRSHP